MKKRISEMWKVVYWFVGIFGLFFPTLIVLKSDWIKTFFTLTFCLFVFWIIVHFKEAKFPWKISEKSKTVVLVIWIMCFVSRLAIILFLNDNMIQISDFGVALQKTADLDFRADYYRVFSHWILYPLINHKLFVMFGENQIVPMIINSAILSLIPVFLYLIGKRIASYVVGIVAALLYIIWPSTALYVTIYTPDHYAALLLTIAVYLVVILFEMRGQINKKIVVITCLLGIVLSISSFFKNFASVFMFALFLMVCIMAIKYKDIQDSLKNVFSLVIIIVVFCVMKSMIFVGVDNLVGSTVGRNIAPCYLNVGLNSSGDGNYNPELYGEYFELLEKTEYDFNKTNSNIINNLKEDIEENYRLLPDKLLQKAERDFQGDREKLYWVKNSLDEKSDTMYSIWIENKLYGITDIYWLFICIWMVFGILWMVLNKNDNTLYIVLCLIGTAIELVLVEAQGRYRYAMEPLFCLMAAVGIYYGVQKVKEYARVH